MSQAIGLLYGHSIARELSQVKAEPDASTTRSLKRKRVDITEEDGDENMNAQEDEDDGGPNTVTKDEEGEWSAEAYITSPNYQARKFVFLLFVNRASRFLYSLLCLFNGINLDRLVESPRLKRAVEAAYGGTLPKGAAPFVYLRFIRKVARTFDTLTMYYSAAWIYHLTPLM